MFEGNDGCRALNFGYNVLNLLSEVKMTGGVLNGFDHLGSLIYRKSGDGLQLELANFGDGVIFGKSIIGRYYFLSPYGDWSGNPLNS